MKEQVTVRRDMAHTILSVLFICLLMAATFWILRPFLISLLWGAIIVIATWPVLGKLQARLGNRRGCAISLLVALMLLIVLVPLMGAVFTIAKNAENLTAQLRAFDPVSLSSPPGWIRDVPLVGKPFADRWTAFASLNPEERYALVTPYAQEALQWFVARAGTTGMMILHFMLALIIAIILYAKGEIVREALVRFSRRLIGRQGEELVVLGGNAVRGVVLGVVGTALVQAAIGGLGIFLAGIPATALFTAVMLILCLAQVGPLVVLIPAVVWLYWSDQPFLGTVLLVLSVLAVTIDNILRPVLIRRGADLPLLLILTGVIGGLIAFGIIGLFIGPVILAVAYTLLTAWVSDEIIEDDASSGAEQLER